MQSQFRIGPYMIALSEIVLGSCDYDFWTNLVKINFRLLRSYMVRFGIDIAIIFGPFLSRLHSYQVPLIKIIAILCDLPLKINTCSQKLLSVQSQNYKKEYTMPMTPHGIYNFVEESDFCWVMLFYTTENQSMVEFNQHERLKNQKLIFGSGQSTSRIQILNFGLSFWVRFE